MKMAGQDESSKSRVRGRATDCADGVFVCAMGFPPADIFWMTWVDWAENTGVSGAGNAGRAKSFIRRFLWVAIFITGLIFTVYSLVDVFDAYYDYDVDTEIKLARYTNVPFPAVTVCNQNRVDCSRLKKELARCTGDNATACQFAAQGQDGLAEVLVRAADVYSMACSASNSTAPAAPTSSGTASGSPPTSGTAAGTGRRRKRQSHGEGQGRGPPPSQDSLGSVSEASDNNVLFTKAFMYFEMANRQLMGHEFGNMVVECTFKQRSCLEEEQFWKNNVPNYGNCFTFNTYLSDDDLGGTRVASLTGPVFGLSLVLNIEQSKYMVNSLTTSAGARVAIHDAWDIPLMDEYGRNLMSNTLTTLAIQELAITRKEAPYSSECASEWGATNYSQYIPTKGEGEYKEGWNYTLPLCQRVCLLATFNEACNCTHPSFLDDDSNRDNPPCEAQEGGSDYDCIQGIYDDLDNGDRECACSVECSETDYNLGLSLAEFPSNKYEATAQALYGFSSGNESMSDNLLELQVYFTSLNVQEITESPVYDSLFSSEFISALGGALSLYLGISIAMFFEILEFVVDFCVNCYLYVFRGKRSVKSRDRTAAGKKDEEEPARPASNLSSVRPYLGYKSPIKGR